MIKYWKMAQYGSDTATKTYGLDQQGKVQKLLSQIIPLTKGIRETENSFFEKYQPGNLGNQGNIVYNKDKQHLNMQKIFSLKKGINPGKENWSYDSENLDAGFNINFTGPRFKEGGLNIDPITLANYTFTEIPLGNVQFANILKPHSKDNLDGLNITNNNGDINAEYLDWTKTTTIPSEDGSVNIITTPPQFAKIAGVVNTKLETNAMAILKDEELANAWWQNILIKNNPKGKPLPMAENGEGLFSREGTEKFVKAYKQYIGTQIPEGRYIDLNSVDGKAFLETEQGQNVIERLKLKYDEDTQKWIQQGVDIDVYEGDDPIEGIVYIDELTGKTKTTGSTGTDKKPNKNIKYIDDLEINLVSQIGPGDSKGRKLIDLNNLEMELSKPPLNIIVKKAENVGGREARTITKTRDGQDYSATIYDNSTVEEIRAQLKYLETSMYS